MNIKAVRRLKRMAVAIAVSGAVFLWTPTPADTVHAENCTHENYEWVTLVKPTCSKMGKDVRVCQDCEEILETEALGTIACHCGPHTLGILYIHK